ncbi:DNA-binding protein [Xanthocytophaga agilis]|uniref:DNA-binding protein n=1 Tax=Xanthocytophaga agilis TaxID=3048010 RepID=A0AAE3UJ79_9BACT|nr:DNA-binding protein [Xanthocytophaga agilis]MDJ1505532.1 DNA-binding protein [Xanthocytophaga agilis]
MQTQPLSLDQKRVWTFEEFCQYTGYSPSFAYKLHMRGLIPGSHKPNGKRLFFDSQKVIAWLLSNPIKTHEQIECEAATYVTLNR